jgi:SAM-dependent methyltransferase
MNEKSSQLSEFDFDRVFEVDDYLYFYADSLTDERTEIEVSAIVDYLEITSPMKILDLACGFGRHANRLAALGHQVTGIDITPGFLDIARKDAQTKDLPVNYQHGDMRTIQYREEFDRVLIMFTSFGYFEDDENLLVLQNVKKALRDDGMVIIDIHNRDVFVKNIQQSFITERNGDLMVDRQSFDSLSGRMYNRRFIIRDGIREDKPFFIRFYNPNEIRSLLCEAGLKLHTMYGGWRGEPVSLDAGKMVIIARK